MGSAALVRDVDGRVLLVEPAYKESWELPGGSVEADELRSSRFVEPAEMDALMSQRLARRTRAALSALVTDTLVEMESGVVLDSPQADWRAGVDAARC